MIPATSHLANKFMTPDKRLNHADKIVEALKVIRQGSQEDIAQASGLDKYQVNKRLSEILGEGRIVIIGTKKLKSGLLGQLYGLPEGQMKLF